MNATQAHWQRVYAEHEPDEVSWYEPVPEASLALIDEAGVARDAPILDAGGGASHLAAELLARGYSDITVADISAESLARARSALGAEGGRVKWAEADLRDHDFGRSFELWHDRAAFHFLVDPADREGYLRVLHRTLRPGGSLVLASFGPAGPTRCSGLPVNRYSAADLSRTLGPGFELVSARLEDHETPAGRSQQFLYALMRRDPAAG